MLPLADYLISRIGLTGTIMVVLVLGGAFIAILWRNHHGADTKND